MLWGFHCRLLEDEWPIGAGLGWVRIWTVLSCGDPSAGGPSVPQLLSLP